MNHQLSDAELVQLIHNHDKTAIEYLYETYKQQVYSYAVSILKPEAAAEDFAGDFFHGLVYEGNLASFCATKGSLGTYINVLLKCRVIDRYRQLTRQQTISLEDVETTISVAERPRVQEKLEIEELTDIVQNVIATRLSPECQRLIQLYYAEGLQLKEIAKLLGVPLGTISGRKFRCIKKLGEHLQVEFQQLNYTPFER